MKINFKTFKTAFAVREELNKYLFVGKSTPSDVVLFATEQRLECSGIVDVEAHKSMGINAISNVPANTTKIVYCSANARNLHWWWIFYWKKKWYMEFYFADESLTEISIEIGVTNV